jgi:hypothetical protein
MDRKLAALSRNRKVERISDERRPGESYGDGNGVWAYLKPGWRCPASDSHACHEYSVEELAKAVRWAEPCRCEDCKRNLEQGRR